MCANSLTRMVSEQTDFVPSDTYEILSNVLSGEELEVDGATELLKTEGEPLKKLVKIADAIRRRNVGEVITYVKNRNINFTNVCIGSCKFCAFRRCPDHPEAFVLSRNEIQKKVRAAVATGATEVCCLLYTSPSPRD